MLYKIDYQEYLLRESFPIFFFIEFSLYNFHFKIKKSI